MSGSVSLYGGCVVRGIGLLTVIGGVVEISGKDWGVGVVWHRERLRRA